MLLAEICSDLTKQPIKTIPLTKGHRLLMGDEAVKGIAQLLKMDPEEISVQINHKIFDIIPNASSYMSLGKKHGIITLPAFTFIDLKELPKELQLTGVNDPKLKSLKTVQKISDWMSDKLSIPKKKVNRKDRACLSLYLRYMENPIQAVNGLKFSIGHELGHIHHFHSSKRLKTSIIPAILSLGIYPLIQKIRHSQKCEKEADAFGCRLSRNVLEGGIYLFKTIQKGPGPFWIDRIVIVFLRIALSFSHTSLDQRIRAIKKQLINK